jgi:integrase
MEVGLLRRLLKRAKRWAALAEDVQMFAEHTAPVGRALTTEEKRRLFQTAAQKPGWSLAYWAAVLAVSTTCRGVELKHLRWGDVDLIGPTMTIRRSKTAAGQRTIPLNGDAIAALARLRERAEAEGATSPEHYVFPACENGHVDPSRPQKSWRTAWRALTRVAGLTGFRFHDLRHHAITELAETGASDATLMAVAGHMSRKMLEHYSHVRMATKRAALDKLESGLMNSETVQPTTPGVQVN